MARQGNTEGLWRSPIHLLHRVGQCSEDAFDAEMGGRELMTPRQLAILMAVAEIEGSTQTGLTERTGIDRATMTDLVRRLQRKR